MKLIACSGGPDSMALLDMERKTGGGLFVCHVNYRKRPTADRDEAIVRQYCETHGIGLAVLYPHYEGGNFQAWARDVRYDFFCRQAHLQGIGTILVAHQQDDLLETYVFQRERHMRCDWYGLRYRSRRQDLMIERPLLGWRKQELEDYCRQNHVPYGVDESNLTDVYARNRIRHGMKKEERPALLREISMANRRLLAKQRRATAFFAVHPAADLFSQEDGPELLETWIWRQTGMHLSGRQTRELFRQLQKDCVAEVKGWLVERHGLLLHMAPVKDLEYQEVVIETQEQLTRYQGVQAAGKTIERFSVTPADYPLCIRSVKPKDAICLRWGTKKLSRYFIDKKISRIDRLKWKVIANREGRVIFMPGIGCDKDHFDSGEVHWFSFQPWKKEL